jgi:hypothetical protein
MNIANLKCWIPCDRAVVWFFVGLGMVLTAAAAPTSGLQEKKQRCAAATTLVVDGECASYEEYTVASPRFVIHTFRGESTKRDVIRDVVALLFGSPLKRMKMTEGVSASPPPARFRCKLTFVSATKERFEIEIFGTNLVKFGDDPDDALHIPADDRNLNADLIPILRRDPTAFGGRIHRE